MPGPVRPRWLEGFSGGSHAKAIAVEINFPRLVGGGVAGLALEISFDLNGREGAI